MADLGIAWSLGEPPGPLFHPGRSAFVLVDGARVGVLGEIHPRVAESLDVPGRIATAELEVDELMRHAATTLQAGDVPRFPPVRRDLSFVLDEAVPHAAVESAIREAGGDLVASCTLFDVHTGPPLPAGKKSLAFSVEFRDPSRTLEREEADAGGRSHQGPGRGGPPRRAPRRWQRSARAASRIDCAPMARHYLSVDDLSPAELIGLLELSGKVKADPEAYADRLRGRSVALIFEKPSTRTRVSFEVGVAELGAHPLVISSTELQLGRGETIEDTGRVLSRYVDAIVLRTFEQERLELLASASSVPVVNSLSDFEHPCQALADLFTIRERLGGPDGTHARLLRGRQQRRALAAARRREGRHEGPGGDTARVRADPAGGEAGRRRSRWRRAARWICSTTRSTRPPAPTSSIPTCGRAWGRRTRRTSASWCSAGTSWTRSWSTSPPRERS